MKRIFAPVLAAALLGAACSTLQISTDYDKNVDFTQYRTFSYNDTGEAKNDIIANRIENVLSDALTAKGLKRVETNGDLWLVAHPRLSKQTQINSYNSGWGYGYGYRGGYGGMGTTTTTVSEIPVGTLVVDIVDRSGEETRVARMLRQVEESAKRRAPIVLLANRLAGRFVAAAHEVQKKNAARCFNRCESVTAPRGMA